MVGRGVYGFGSIVNLILSLFSTFAYSHFWCLSITVNACLMESIYSYLGYSVLQTHFLVCMSFWSLTALTVYCKNIDFILFLHILTLLSRETPKKVIDNSADANQTTQNKASDQGRHSLH